MTGILGVLLSLLGINVGSITGQVGGMSAL